MQSFSSSKMKIETTLLLLIVKDWCILKRVAVDFCTMFETVTDC